jgi:hypothetical protein
MENVLEFSVFDAKNGFKHGRIAVELQVFSAKNGVPEKFNIKKVETSDSAAWWKTETTLRDKEEDIKFWWVNAQVCAITDPQFFLNPEGQVKRIATPSWVKYPWGDKPSGKGF